MLQWRYQSPFGPIDLEVSEKGVHCIHFVGNGLRREPAKGNPPEAVIPLVQAVETYFSGRAPELDTVRFDWSDATPFQTQVWRELTRVGFGQVISYSALAGRVGAPDGARAVAGAMAANPIPILVPCHRVVRSNGDLGGYSAGLDWKVKLLQHEGVKVVRTKGGRWIVGG